MSCVGEISRSCVTGNLFLVSAFSCSGVGLSHKTGVLGGMVQALLFLSLSLECVCHCVRVRVCVHACVCKRDSETETQRKKQKTCMLRGIIYRKGVEAREVGFCL